VISVVAGYNLVLPFMLFLVYKLAGSKKTVKKFESEPDYAVIVTAYEQTDTLKAAVASLLKLNYGNYLVYVVADKCDISNLHFDVTGAGFDKVLQIEIVKSKKRIAFARNAIVYDEKTSKSDQLVKQRARWFNTWFKYAPYGFRLLFSGLLKLDWNQFLFALLF